MLKVGSGIGEVSSSAFGTVLSVSIFPTLTYLESDVLVTSVKPIWEPISSDPRSYILFLRAYA